MPHIYTWLERLVSSVSIPSSLIRIQTTQLKNFFFFFFQGRVRKLTNNAFATCELGLGSAGYANGTADGARSGLWMGLGVPVPISCFVKTAYTGGQDFLRDGLYFIPTALSEGKEAHSTPYFQSLCKRTGLNNIRTTM